MLHFICSYIFYWSFLSICCFWSLFFLLLLLYFPYPMVYYFNIPWTTFDCFCFYISDEPFQNVNSELRELPAIELSTLPLILKVGHCFKVLLSSFLPFVLLILGIIFSQAVASFVFLAYVFILKLWMYLILSMFTSVVFLNIYIYIYVV